MRAGPVCGGGGLRTRWPERIGNDQMAGEESRHLHIAHLTHTPHHYTHSNDPYQTRKALGGKGTHGSSHAGQRWGQAQNQAPTLSFLGQRRKLRLKSCAVLALAANIKSVLRVTLQVTGKAGMGEQMSTESLFAMNFLQSLPQARTCSRALMVPLNLKLLGSGSLPFLLCNLVAGQ